MGGPIGLMLFYLVPLMMTHNQMEDLMALMLKFLPAMLVALLKTLAQWMGDLMILMLKV